jgi:hypothetical protein
MRDGAPMNAPGWYPDPSNERLMRWWDGQQWSLETQTKEAVRAGFSAPLPATSWGPSPAKDLERVESDGRRARAWLWVGVGLYAYRFAVSALTTTYTRQTFEALFSSRRPRPTVPAPPAWVTGLSWSSQLVSIATLIVGVLFAIWLQHAAELSRNLRLPARRTPGWAFGGFILPIVNFWFPYQVARDCLPPDHAGRSLVGRWWALYLTMTFMGLVILVMAWMSPWLGSAGAVLAVAVTCLAGIAARDLIAVVTAAQRELIAPYLEASTPPPIER